MRPAALFFHRGFSIMVNGRLRGVWVRGQVPQRKTVWAANHHSWWDPFLADVLVSRVGGTTGLIMDDANLESFRFLRRVGVVGTTELRPALQLLADGRVLVVFPEAELRPSGAPGPLADGAAWIAKRTGATLVSAAVRLAMRGHEAPEAYVDLRVVPIADTVALTTERLASTLAAGLADIDAALSGTDPRIPLPGFEQVISGRRSWDERLARLAGRG